MDITKNLLARWLFLDCTTLRTCFLCNLQSGYELLKALKQETNWGKILPITKKNMRCLILCNNYMYHLKVTVPKASRISVLTVIKITHLFDWSFVQEYFTYKCKGSQDHIEEWGQWLWEIHEGPSAGRPNVLADLLMYGQHTPASLPTELMKRSINSWPWLYVLMT